MKSALLVPLTLALAVLWAAPSLAGTGAADAFGDAELLVDLQPGPDGSQTGPYVSLGDRVLFFTSALDHRGQSVDHRLWGTDGTAAGTVRLPPDDDLVPSSLVVAPGGGLAFFQTEDGDEGADLWRTDGTIPGTVELTDGTGIAGPHRFEPVGPYVFTPDDRFFFAGRTGTGETADVEPWVSDGTSEGTFRLVDAVPGADDSGVFDMALFDGAVYFLAADSSSGQPVAWRTDGTPEGTAVAIAPDSDFRRFTLAVATGSSLYFAGRDGEGHLAIWRSDGTGAGTVELARIGDTRPWRVRFLAALPGGAGERTVWLTNDDESTGRIWALDGTPGGAEAVGEITPDQAVARAAVLDGAVYFNAHSQSTGTELFRSDGTPAGTGPAFDFCPGSCSGVTYSILVPFGDRLLLRTSEAAEPAGELMVTDGSLVGTRVLDLCPGDCRSSPLLHSGVALKGAFVFPGHDVSLDDQLWVTDGTASGTETITSVENGVIAGPARAGEHLVFSARDAAHGSEPWVLPFDAGKIDPLPPPGSWHAGPGLPGFEVKARIRAGGETIATAVEPECIPETLCLSGALPGRSELFVRIVGPKPNGFLWPTLVKFSTSEIEVWIRQTAPGPTRGEVRYYRLEGARPGFDELPGLFDRDGFRPLS